MPKPPALAFSHMGIFVTDLERMRDFYARVLGFVVTDEGDLGHVQLVFLSRDPREHHQLVLASGRPDRLPFNVVNQISFRAESLADLRRLKALLRAEAGAGEVTPISHGIAWSLYFRDPEGNRIEVFVDSPWYVSQPIREPIDLDRPDEEILRETEARVRDDPSFRPLAAWR